MSTAHAVVLDEYFYRIDMRAFPRVRVTMKADVPITEAAVKRFFFCMEAPYDRAAQAGHRFTLLVDTSRMSVPPWHFVSALGAWIARMHPRSEALLEQSVIVIANAVVRAFVRAAFLIKRPVRPNRIFGTLGEAVQYLAWL